MSPPKRSAHILPIKRSKLRRKLVLVGRIANSGLHNLVRNLSLTLAAISVMVVTLSLILTALMINKVLADTIDDRTDDFSVGLFFNDGVDQQLVDGLRGELESKEYVERVIYISKDEARQRFIDQNEDSAFVEAGLALTEENILPASFDVRFNDLSQVDEILALAASETYAPMIYDTSDNEITRSSIGQYLSIKDGANKAMVVAVVVFSSMSALIVFNTMRMAVYSRSDEIEIKKLIGATPNYIRGPFLVEASLYGVISGLMSFSVAYAILNRGITSVSSLNSVKAIQYFSANWLWVLLATVGTGVLIGLISSVMAMVRYLRLKTW